ncbi:MAG: hypothetical protein ACNI25_10290 [Halarcobacter sp.]
MNLIEVLVAFFLFVVVLIVFFILLKKNKKSVNKKSYVVKNTPIDIPMPSSIGLWLPKNIEDISKYNLRGIVKKVYDAYTVFDYKNMSLNSLDKKEWHTWQVSLVLMLFKYDEEFFIPNQEEVFHDFLLKADKNSIKSLMNGILRKYKTNVDINASKDFLSKEYIWSNREISIIFYFLANYKKYN